LAGDDTYFANDTGRARTRARGCSRDQGGKLVGNFIGGENCPVAILLGASIGEFEKLVCL
jgi:hypothetical protein